MRTITTSNLTVNPHVQFLARTEKHHWLHKLKAILPLMSRFSLLFPKALLAGVLQLLQRAAQPRAAERQGLLEQQGRRRNPGRQLDTTEKTQSTLTHVCNLEQQPREH